MPETRHLKLLAMLYLKIVYEFLWFTNIYLRSCKLWNNTFFPQANFQIRFLLGGTTDSPSRPQMSQPASPHPISTILFIVDAGCKIHAFSAACGKWPQRGSLQFFPYWPLEGMTGVLEVNSAKEFLFPFLTLFKIFSATLITLLKHF